MSKRKPDKSDHSAFQETFQRGVESLRQLMRPGAFRTSAPPASEPGLQEPPAAPAASSTFSEEQFAMAQQTLAAVATAVWRAKCKLDSEEQAEFPDELRHLPRHIQAAWDALAAGQVQIDDPTGRTFVPGLAVNALAIQPLEGITCEVIAETIKPSVYINGALIQQADVIVGTPVEDSESLGTSDDPLQEPASDNRSAPGKRGAETDGPDND